MHCTTEADAFAMRNALSVRFAECGLEPHPQKTQIVYCKDGRRKGRYPRTSFDFLGFTFRPRLVKNSKRNSIFVSFTPAVSQSALKAMREQVRRSNVRNRTDWNLALIAYEYNPVLRGWLVYYGRCQRSAMYPLFRHFNKTLVAWAMRKYKRFRRHKTRASKFLQGIAERHPGMFVHWNRGMRGAFA